MKHLRYLIALIALLAVSNAWAVGGGSGSWSIGGNIGFINSDQEDMNKVIDAVASGASKFGNAWEGNAQITRRLSGSSIAIGLRPSYYYYKEESGTDAKYNLGGFTIFPMLKWYMLEDKSIKFYSQFGIGYGHMSGEIEETGGNVKFSGSNIGYMLGLGAEFCIVPGHCINVEGGARFLSFNRFIVDSTSGFFTGDSIITQADKGKEFEIEDDGERDFAASMSGILAMLGYTFYF